MVRARNRPPLQPSLPRHRPLPEVKTRLERLGAAVRRAMQEAEDKQARRAAEQERDRLLEAERRARQDAENATDLSDLFATFP